ncbi:hypothetical protein GHV57_00535 [Pseudomonas aeruginosa]|nr:hypothetical protein [Pseudomonas aeruginosa]
MHPTPRLAAALLAGSGLGWPLLAQADLVEDSHASLERGAVGVPRGVRPRRARDDPAVVHAFETAGGCSPGGRVRAPPLPFLSCAAS